MLCLSRRFHRVARCIQSSAMVFIETVREDKEELPRRRHQRGGPSWRQH